MSESYQNLPPLGPRPEKDPRVANDVERLLTTISKDKKRVPNLADVVEHLIDQWGGARQFANSYYTEYKRATSVHFRGRMLESILRLMQAYAAQAGPQEEISGLSDQELRSVAASLLGPFYAKQKEADSRLQLGSADQKANSEQEEEADTGSAGSSSASSAAGTSRSASAGPGLSTRDCDSRPGSDR